MRDRFRAAGIESADLDARLLAQKAFELDAMGLLAGEAEPVADDARARLEELAVRRLAGEPVARILGAKEFYGLDFIVGPSTLVPRPETEMLVDTILEFCARHPTATLLDLGTGTGCIAIAALVHASQATGVAIDLNPDAVAVANVNRQRHGLDARLDIRTGSWFAPLVPSERFDIIVSNPPYIESDVITGLAKEVRLFDPHLALDGGKDGLAPYRIIAAEALDHLTPGGMLVLEIGAGQGDAVPELLDRHGFSGTRVENDLAGLARRVIAHHPLI